MQPGVPTGALCTASVCGAAYGLHMTERAGKGSTRTGERRLPMALAVVVAGGLSLLIPEDFRVSRDLGLGYVVVLLLLLVVLIVGDPGRIDREKRWLRITTGVMIAFITLSSMLAVVRLVLGILEEADFATPGQLLAIGGVVWISNVIAFSLWYWHLDGGGPAARAHGTSTGPPAFQFPEEGIPALVEAGWYPQYVDYLALSFNASTAFSPSDVSAVRHWSKLWLMTESLISLTLLALVLARAINVL